MGSDLKREKYSSPEFPPEWGRDLSNKSPEEIRFLETIWRVLKKVNAKMVVEVESDLDIGYTTTALRRELESYLGLPKGLEVVSNLRREKDKSWVLGFINDSAISDISLWLPAERMGEWDKFVNQLTKADNLKIDSFRDNINDFYNYFGTNLEEVEDLLLALDISSIRAAAVWLERKGIAEREEILNKLLVKNVLRAYLYRNLPPPPKLIFLLGQPWYGTLLQQTQTEIERQKTMEGAAIAGDLEKILDLLPRWIAIYHHRRIEEVKAKGVDPRLIQRWQEFKDLDAVLKKIGLDLKRRRDDMFGQFQNYFTTTVDIRPAFAVILRDPEPDLEAKVFGESK